MTRIFAEWSTNNRQQVIANTRMPNRSKHVGRVSRVHGLILVLLVTPAGCARELPLAKAPQPRTELIDSEIPALLLSEALSGTGRVNCPITLTNSTSGPQKLEFRGTGCSCYGATLDGRKLEKGEFLELPAGKSLNLDIEADAPKVETLKQLDVYFGRVADGKTRSVAGTCRFNVYSDVRFEPEFLNLQLQSETGPRECELLLYRCFRSETGESVDPELKSMPAEATVVSIGKQGGPELLEKGLWRCTWTVHLRITPSPETDVDAPPHTVQAWFPQQGDVRSSGGSFQLVVRRDLPLRYPRTVYFGKMQVGRARSQKLLITSTGERNFELAVENADGEDVVPEILEEASTRKHWVSLTLTPQAPGQFRQRVGFTTNLPELPQFDVEVTALVEK